MCNRNIRFLKANFPLGFLANAGLQFTYGSRADDNTAKKNTLAKMQMLYILLLSCCIIICNGFNDNKHDHSQGPNSVRNPVEREPTVLIPLLIRNKAHILPYFLNYLQNLNYPKDRISIW